MQIILGGTIIPGRRGTASPGGTAGTESDRQLALNVCKPFHNRSSSDSTRLSRAGKMWLRPLRRLACGANLGMVIEIDWDDAECMHLSFSPPWRRAHATSQLLDPSKFYLTSPAWRWPLFPAAWVCLGCNAHSVEHCHSLISHQDWNSSLEKQLASSWFFYNMSRSYPYRWFTPVALCGWAPFLGLFTWLNVSANSFEQG
jgi:hypothetical protein